MDMETDSLSKGVTIFLTYLFMVLIAYFMISVPVNALFDAFGSADLAEATDEMALYLPNIRTAFNLFFAGMLAVPMTWFISWVFSREPAYYRLRR